MINNKSLELIELIFEFGRLVQLPHQYLPSSACDVFDILQN